MCRRLLLALVGGVAAASAALHVEAADPVRRDRANGPSEARVVSPLSPQLWSEIDRSVDRGLNYLARRQSRDGSFEAPLTGQPAITSLCVMAYLSRGHLAGRGPYAGNLSRAVDYVLSTQQQGGLLSAVRVGEHQHAHMYGAYNHAIAGVMLGEVYGMSDADQQDRLRRAILGALRFSHDQQTRAKRYADDRGGWRYLRQSGGNDSDLSLTAWNLMFLRSARNAEFNVPEHDVDAAMQYIRRCFDDQQGAFVYALRGSRRYVSRGMVGAGVVALSLGGEHQTERAQQAGDWILAHSFDRYNGPGTHEEDRYHYSAFCCSQAMFQLGGDRWQEFYPRLAQTLIAHQNPDGSWDPEAQQDGLFGNSYTTALAILALTPAYQLLPIYQR